MKHSFRGHLQRMWQIAYLITSVEIPRKKALDDLMISPKFNRK